jgi:hypothetical protein
VTFPQVTVVSLDDGQLVEFIKQAQETLLFAGPGVSLLVAEALAQKWRELDPASVSILLDVDPEVCRLGYGTVQAIELLHQTALKMGQCLHHRPGIRVGLVGTERATLVFAPIPLLIEAESVPFPRPNAVCLDSAAEDPASPVETLKREADDLIHGSEPVDNEKVEELARDLAENPPLKFDLARVVHVFNARFQFVEFELSGLLVSRMTAPIPPDLLGLAGDEETQKLLHSTFKLVRDDSKISGAQIFERKRTISGKYLFSLKGYGTVCLRANKEAFLTEVEALKKEITQFQKRIEQQLQSEMDHNRGRLVKALLPAVYENPPQRWIKFLGPRPKKSVLREHLVRELEESFGSAQDLIKEMNATVIFKDVTYESLNDPNFIGVARKAIPDMKALHEEHFAAEANPQVRMEA